MKNSYLLIYGIVILGGLTLFSGLQAATSTSTKQILPLDQATLKGDEEISTPYGLIKLEDNYITEGQQTLFDAMDLQRATQAYIWSTPYVSFKQWQVAQEKVFGANKLGDFVVYKSLKEKRGVVTGNLTTPYIMSLTNIRKQGAIKIIMPAGAVAGGVLDMWQKPITDLGQTGPDKGKGGTYIIVGPQENIAKYKGKADYVYQSDTNNIFIGLRVLSPSPTAEDDFEKNMKISYVGNKPQSIHFIKNVDKEWSATAPRGLEYWKLLSQLYQEEPTREQDKAFAAMLEPLGVGKGIKFQPNKRQMKILKQAAALGELMLRNLQTNPRYTQPYWKGTYWYKSFDFHIPQQTANKVEIDERAVWFYEAVGSSEGMVNPTPGLGQVFMTTKRDSNGELLRADQTYHLHIPKAIPAKQFWSVTLYSEDTRRPYDNQGTTIPSVNLNSRLKSLQYNKDGSLDIYIGAKAPKGKESNFLKTVGDDGWFVYFRLYAPTEAFFNKSFKLPDFEKIQVK